MRRLVLWAGFEFAILVLVVIVRTVFWTYGADTGTFAQLISSFPQMRDALEGGSHFRFHWSPSLALLWPLVAVTRNAVLIQVLQALATITTAPLLALLFRPYLGAALSNRLGYVALLYPPLIALGFDEFHELGLFPPLAIAMLLCADRGRWGWYALCTLLALGIREDVCIELALLGIVFAFVSRPFSRPALLVAGIATSCASALTLFIYYGIVVPRLGGWTPSHFYTYPFASGPLALLLACVTHPLDVARVVFIPGKYTYLLEAFAPLAFLPLFTRWWLLAVPGFAIVLLANDSYVWRMGDHYVALWVPWLLVATGIALYRLQKRSEKVPLRWTTAALAICVVVLIAFNPMHPLHYLHPAYRDMADAERSFSCVPKDALVATHGEWYPPHAVEYWNATVSVDAAADYLIYADDYPNDEFQHHTRPIVDAAAARGAYRVLCRYGNVSVYQRAAALKMR